MNDEQYISRFVRCSSFIVHCPLYVYGAINKRKDFASLYPVMIRPSGITDTGVLVIPNLSVSFMVSSTAVASHLGGGTGFFSKASSRRASDFSQTMVFDFWYAAGWIF